MMNILIAIDEIAIVEAMKQFLLKQKWSGESSFRILHAIEPLKAAAEWPSDVYRKDAQQLLTEAGKSFREGFPGVVVEELLMDGRARDEILALAESWPADLIVMGSHGRTGVERIMLGSVAYAVSTHAPCPVVIVRKQAASSQTGSRVVA
jgi:nucleotide-binding universal stress UspA family protein